MKEELDTNIIKMHNLNMKYSLNDIFVVPAPVSTIESRAECNPCYSDGMLPLFTAPMSSVVGLENHNLYKENKIHPIIPRTVSLSERMILCLETWCAFSLTEFIDFLIKAPSYDMDAKLLNGYKMHVLIDIANGHMLKLHDSIRDVKNKFGDKIVIMAGNIANPETYRLLSEAGADFVRLGIGSGSACITASNTAIHYPMASLIKDCFDISMSLSKPAKIVADGGIKGFSDIIKCLALGADYVMCGSVFNKMLESSGETTVTWSNSNKYPLTKKINQLDPLIKLNFDKSYIGLCKKHYGMSTRKAQLEINGVSNKTSEGIERTFNVEYTMSQWVDNFTDYLKSSMSYTSRRELSDFIGNVETIIVSNNSYNSVNK